MFGHWLLSISPGKRDGGSVAEFGFICIFKVFKVCKPVIMLFRQMMCKKLKQAIFVLSFELSNSPTAIFWKSRGFKDIKYDISSKIFHQQFPSNIFHQNFSINNFSPKLVYKICPEKCSTEICRFLSIVTVVCS